MRILVPVFLALCILLQGCAAAPLAAQPATWAPPLQIPAPSFEIPSVVDLTSPVQPLPMVVLPGKGESKSVSIPKEGEAESNNTPPRQTCPPMPEDKKLPEGWKLQIVDKTTEAVAKNTLYMEITNAGKLVAFVSLHKAGVQLVQGLGGVPIYREYVSVVDTSIQNQGWATWLLAKGEYELAMRLKSPILRLFQDQVGGGSSFTKFLSLFDRWYVDTAKDASYKMYWIYCDPNIAMKGP